MGSCQCDAGLTTPGRLPLQLILTAKVRLLEVKRSISQQKEQEKLQALDSSRDSCLKLRDAIYACRMY